MLHANCAVSKNYLRKTAGNEGNWFHAESERQRFTTEYQKTCICEGKKQNITPFLSTKIKNR